MTAERDLWIDVIIQAAQDVEVPTAVSRWRKVRGKRIISPYWKHAKRQAEQWFMNNGEDFRMVCAMAGLDPDFIREAFMDGKLSYDRLSYYAGRGY